MNENKTPCEKCKEEKTPAQVPFYVFESVQYRHERELHRQQIITGAMAAIAVLSNAAWILHYFGVL